MKRRGLLFSLLCVGCALGAGGYFRMALHRSAPTVSVQTPAPAVQESAPATRKTPRPARPRQLLFSSTAAGHHNDLAIANLEASDPTAVQFYGALNCLRMDYRANHGICLRTNITTPGYPTDAVIFDQHFAVKQVIPFSGIVSRTRVSPDGKTGAVTVFRNGDSYTNSQMSTQTMLIDLEKGTTVVDLEAYAVSRDNRPFKELDFNFWGVTFTKDSRHFYATLGTGGKTYLVKGDMDARAATVITEGVECPSLSPDNTHVAFKRRNPGLHVTWRLSVLDLTTLTITDLPEPRTIDQQVQWLDNQHVLYSLTENEHVIGGTVNAMTIASDGNSPSKKLFANADNPLVF